VIEDNLPLEPYYVNRILPEGFAGVVAIVDADFDRLLGKSYDLENLCLTDHHDLDLTIFASTALDKYLAQHANAPFNVAEIRHMVLKAARAISCCRFVSEKFKLALYFKNLAHEALFSVDDLSMGIEGLVAELINRSKTRCTPEHLKALIAVEEASDYDLLEIVNGHDAAAVLGISLRKMFGSRRDIHTWASEVEAGLRLAYDREKFSASNMSRFLMAWQREKKSFRIFAP
jgi:hypothetical protein